MDVVNSNFPFNNDYETVAASQSNVVLGGNGALGDVIQYLEIVPVAATVGTVSLKDGSDSAFVVYGGGLISADVRGTTIKIPLNIRSRVGAWQVTTGVSLSVVAVGRFT